ncbi:CHR23 [Symbiodinium necroappetens]|uniref:CHR23 protein n=1 Tax=Symbiodinium necroappetens TaxID=1628268 RepID=A0A812JP11_9DINO|nr:CHR23 [Symbiodinium necroappetens]CAE7850758.1 CHR23 [Symbiodinium microadriaticum]
MPGVKATALSAAILVSAARAEPLKVGGIDLDTPPSHCAPLRDAEVPKAATLGFVSGAMTASAVYWIHREQRRRRQPGKATHPREWAIWTRLDRKKKGYVTRKDLKSLCYRFESDEHAEHLAKQLDPWGMDHINFSSFINNFKVVQMMRQAGRLKLWHRCCGLGVAGNVAGHMAQAGEAGQESHSATKPAAIFSYYMPPHPYQVSDQQADKKRLQEFPVTYAVIDYPKLPGACKVQVEPELGLLVDIVYTKDRKRVDHLVPRRVAAFNDCSIRSLEGAEKLSMKKNWGFGSKGISLRSFPVDGFGPGTFVDFLALVSYMKRDGEVFQYSVKAPVRNYLLFHEPLLEWIVEQINGQKDTDKWEEIFPQLAASDFPTSSWIALGAGEYTDYGATHFLQPLDEVVVVVYDERVMPDGPGMAQVLEMFEDTPAPAGSVMLHQTFV